MEFSITRSVEILERTPTVLEELTSGLSPEWTTKNEGGDTWSVYDVVGHLLHGEKTDWMARAERILSDHDKTFAPFDRFAQFEMSKGKTLAQLLQQFRTERENNLQKLISLHLTEADLLKTGIHPTFGTVTLSQLIATWWYTILII